MEGVEQGNIATDISTKQQGILLSFPLYDTLSWNIPVELLGEPFNLLYLIDLPGTCSRFSVSRVWSTVQW